MNDIKIGWGEADIILGGKVFIAGMVPFRAVDEVHDNIRATAMAVQSEQGRVIWVSCDFCHPTAEVEQRLAQLLHQRLPDFEDGQLILSGTHSTACFYLSDSEILSSAHLLDEVEDLLPLDEARERFCSCAADAVMMAIDSLEHEDVECASIDILTGFCRRPVYSDGSAVMYGDVHRDDFVRMEYPDGGETKALYFYERGTRKLRAILAAAPCPAQADESSSYITADYWGYARNCVKAELGEDVKLLSLCRAAGELSPHRLFALDRGAEWGQAAAQRLGEWVGENLIAFASRTSGRYCCADMALEHLTEALTFPAREITEGQYRWACAYLADKQNYSEDGRALDWISENNAHHIKAFKESGISEYKARVSVLRLGRTVLFTAPAELYTEYAKRIIAKSRGYDIIDVQLTHDSIGYLPTREAIEHGGYSTHHVSALCDDIGGELYVAEMAKMIDNVIKEGNS